MSNLENSIKEENLDADFETCHTEQEQISQDFELAIDDNQMLLQSLEAHVNKSGVNLDIPDFVKEKDEVIAQRDLEVSEI